MTDRADPEANAIAERYEVTGVPTLVFARPDGTRLRPDVNTVDTTTVALAMEEALERAQN